MKLRYLAIALFGLCCIPSVSQAVTADELRNLRGVSLPSLEWACVEYSTYYDFPLPDTAEILTDWNLDTVRLPLNQDCWLENPRYQDTIEDLVNTFAEHNFSIILDLHWNTPPGRNYHKQQLMADAAGSPLFWRSVANTFKDEPAVIAYELYNEPHDISYDCWLHGCVTPEGWQAAGMQSLVNAVRETGSTQWLIINGLYWGNDVVGAAEHLPTDPLVEDKLALGWHTYDKWYDPDNCTGVNCLQNKINDLADTYPIIITEFGTRKSCDARHDMEIMQFAKQAGLGFTAWAWYPADCGFPSLIEDWDGTPTEAGHRLCEFMDGDCSLPPNTSTTDSEGSALSEVVTTDTFCLINFESEFLTSDTIPCTGSAQLTVRGVQNQHWADRVSSWSITGDWIAVSRYDTEATVGSELWLNNSFGLPSNVAPEANDATSWVLVRPTQNGSLTIYDGLNKTGAFLKFKL